MGQAEPRGDTREEELRPHEMEVLTAMARGLRDAEIAAYPAYREAALALQDEVSAAVGATELREWNARI